MGKDKLDALQPKLLSEMTNDELFEFIRELRRQRKVPQRVLKAKEKKKRTEKGALEKLLKALPPDKLKEILNG